MSKTIAAVLVGGALIGGAYWVGKSSDEVRAAPVEPERAVVLAPAPSRAVPRPALPVRRPAPGLAADLVAADPKIRRAAVAEAARSDDPSLLLAASRDSDVDVARTAIAAVNTLFADGRIDPGTMTALATDRTIPDRARLLAINGLGAVPSPETATLLARLLATGTTLERRAASALLGGHDPEIAIPALIAALADGDKYVPRQAADSLRLLSRGRDFGTDAGAWQAWWQARR